MGALARVSRTFDPSDLACFATLGGGSFDTVPEPLVGGMFSYLLGVKLPVLGTNYLKQATAFHGIALPGEELDATVTVTRLRPEKHLVDLATMCRGGDGRLIASGRALVYVRDVVQ